MISFRAQLSTIQYTAGDTEDRMKYSSQFQEDTFVWSYIMTSKFHIRTVCCLGRFVASFVCSLSPLGLRRSQSFSINTPVLCFTNAPDWVISLKWIYCQPSLEGQGTFTTWGSCGSTKIHYLASPATTLERILSSGWSLFWKPETT